MSEDFKMYKRYKVLIELKKRCEEQLSSSDANLDKLKEKKENIEVEVEVREELIDSAMEMDKGFETRITKEKNDFTQEIEELNKQIENIENNDPNIPIRHTLSVINKKIEEMKSIPNFNSKDMGLW